MAGPLEGLVVIEASWGAPGRVVGMLLADYGAEVVAVRLPGGGVDAGNANWKAWDRSKRRVELDLREEGDVEQLHQLLERADIFVEALGPGRASSVGLDAEAVKSRHPRLVHCAVSGYGQEGPWRDRPGYDCLVAARMGVMAEQAGFRPGPHFLGHPSLVYGTAFLATIGTLAALRARRTTGQGQLVDVSILDAVLAQSAMNWWWNEQELSYLARSGTEQGFGRKRLITDEFICADGEYLMIHTGGEGGFKRTMDLLGLGDKVRAVDGLEMGVPLDDEEYHAARHLAPEAFKTKPRDEWAKLFMAADLAVLPILRPGEVLLDEQVAFAGVVAEVPDPDHGSLRQSGACITFADAPPAPPRPAHPVGDAETVETVAGSLVPSQPVATGGDLPQPLSGIRILDFSAYFATAYGAKLLSDLGADVIKVEPLQGDQMRALPDPFEACQRGKRAIAIDLKDPQALEVVHDLVRTADVVMHNFRPGKAEKIGIGYEQLRAIKPDLVYCYLPGFGSRGPKSHLKSFAPLLSGFTGPLFEAAGEGNRPVRRSFGNEDYNNGFVGAVAVLMALEHRARTGRGQYVENPQLHSSLFVQTHQMLDPDGHSVTGWHLDAEQMGWGPLYRLYRSADGWICLACVGDRAYDRLVRALGVQALADDRFGEEAGRRDHAGDLVAILETTFGGLASEEIVARLDAARVPCEVAAEDPKMPEFLWDEWAFETDRVVEQHSELYGWIREVGFTIRLPEMRSVNKGPAPLLAEHNRSVLEELGWAEERIDETLAGPFRAPAR